MNRWRVSVLCAIIACIMLGVSQPGLVAKIDNLGKVFVHTIHTSNTVRVGRVYTQKSRAAKDAEGVYTGDPNTWVIVNQTEIWGNKKKDVVAFLRNFGLIGEVLNAQIVLDNDGTTSVTLPTQVRSGEFLSPDVQFTTTFETIVFDLLLPVDTDWLNSANSIEIAVYWSPDRTPGSWVWLGGSFATYGSGRPLGKDGQPNPGGHIGVTNRDGQTGQSLPLSTWYHATLSAPNPMTIGGTVSLSNQSQ